MIKTQIITEDERFKRLLTLELDSLCEFTDAEPELIVTDADTAADRPGRYKIYFGRKYANDYGIREGDVFLHRPFDMEELTGIVSQIARNETHAGSPPGVEIKGENVYYNGDPVPFTAAESTVFRYIYERRGTVVSRDEIKELIKRNKNAAESNSGDVYIRMIRKKLDEVYGVRIIRSSRGKGYYID